MKKVKLPKMECLRCGKKWHPRSNEVKMCPQCKNPNFDQPKKEKIEHKE